MEEWFDLHLYLANWGTHPLMIRIPERLIDRRLVDACLVEPEFATVRSAGENLILAVSLNEPNVDWDDGPGLLDALAPLRADLLAGDARVLYLIWLMAVEFDVVRDDTPEPLPGLGPLTGPLEAFAAFFCIDPDLIHAAAERNAAPDLDAVAPDAVRDAISALSDQEKTTLLSRLAEGDPHVAAELRAMVRDRLESGRQTTPTPPRTVGDLRARAEVIKFAREQQTARLKAEEHERHARQDEEKRRTRLLAIARRGEGPWRDVEAEIERSNASSYDRAADLLLDLKAIADERDMVPDFARRVVAIRERHARKARFLQRIASL